MRSPYSLCFLSLVLQIVRRRFQMVYAVQGLVSVPGSDRAFATVGKHVYSLNPHTGLTVSYGSHWTLGFILLLASLWAVVQHLAFSFVLPLPWSKDLGPTISKVQLAIDWTPSSFATALVAMN